MIVTKHSGTVIPLRCPAGETKFFVVLPNTHLTVLLHQIKGTHIINKYILVCIIILLLPNTNIDFKMFIVLIDVHT